MVITKGPLVDLRSLRRWSENLKLTRVDPFKKVVRITKKIWDVHTLPLYSRARWGLKGKGNRTIRYIFHLHPLTRSMDDWIIRWTPPVYILPPFKHTYLPLNQVWWAASLSVCGATNLHMHLLWSETPRAPCGRGGNLLFLPALTPPVSSPAWITEGASHKGWFISPWASVSLLLGVKLVGYDVVHWRPASCSTHICPRKPAKDTRRPRWCLEM